MSLQPSLEENGCTPEEFQQFLNGTMTCLTRGDSIGLAVIVEAALLSVAAIFCLFVLITRNIWRVRHNLERVTLFRFPIDTLLFSIIGGDIMQATSMILNLRWIIDGKLTEGTFCTVQGIIGTIGSTAVALFTLVIAIYTFVEVWFAKTISMRVTVVVVVAIWTLDAVIALVGPLANAGQGKPSYMTIAPYWCSTNGKHYLVWKAMSDYAWRWLTLFCSFVLYIPLYLWVRGNLVLSTPWWRVQFRRAPQVDINRPKRFRALVMLAYPLVYCVLVLPVTIVRWITWWTPMGQYHVPSSATFASVALFGLSGLFNVILLLATRPKSGLIGGFLKDNPIRP